MIAWILATASSAQSVDVEIASASGAFDAEALEADMEALANETLRFIDIETYLDRMADASAIATKGMGVDYAESFERVTFGGSVGTAVSGVGIGFVNGDGELPEGGFSAAVSAMAALNLGAFSGGEGALRHFRLSANGLYAPLPSGTPFNGTMFNYGGHVQIGGLGLGQGDAMVQWGGLAITGGIEGATYQLDLGQPLPIDAGGGLSWEADGEYALSSSAINVPLELSTSLKVSLARAWLGGGYDLGLTSKTAASADVDGPVTLDGTEVGSGGANVEADGTAAPGRIRLFGGAMVSLAMIRVLAQLNVGLDDTYGGHVGVRVAL